MPPEQTFEGIGLLKALITETSPAPGLDHVGQDRRSLREIRQMASTAG
jgi:hypothetical protein